jgi:hypothetical protein
LLGIFLSFFGFLGKYVVLIGDTNLLVRVLEENIESRRVVEGISEFVRVNGMNDYMEYPENKGGGKRRSFIWEWKA